MAFTGSHSLPSMHLNSSFQRLTALLPVFDGVLVLLLPPLLALVISAAFAGHGHISGQSVADVVNMMAQAAMVPTVSP